MSAIGWVFWGVIAVVALFVLWVARVFYLAMTSAGGGEGGPSDDERPARRDLPPLANPPRLCDGGSLYVPELDAELDEPARIWSTSTRGVSYQVNPARLSCTCPAQQEAVANFPHPRDVRRVCKHLVMVLSWPKVQERLDGPVAAVVRRGVWERASKRRGVLERHFFEWELGGSPVFLGTNPESRWVSVVARRRKKGDRHPVYTGKYEMFAFNLDESGWAFDVAPPGAGELRRAIAAVSASLPSRTADRSASPPPAAAL